MIYLQGKLKRKCNIHTDNALGLKAEDGLLLEIALGWLSPSLSVSVVYSSQQLFSVTTVATAIEDTRQDDEENGNSSRELDVTFDSGAIISSK